MTTPAGTLTLADHTFRLLRLPAGTRLFHGTNCAGGFERIDAPAWFCLTEPLARRWAGWWESVPDGRTAGEKAVVEYETRCALYLLDTDDGKDMHRLNRAVTGKLYTGRPPLARVLRDAGLPGWVGNNEVCLTSTSGLRLIEKRAVVRAAG